MATLSWSRHLRRGAGLLFVTSGASYALGLVRDRVLAASFGASAEMDAYQAAFIVPDFLFNLLVAGALTAAFIPVFTDLRVKGRERAAGEMAGAVLSFGILALAVAGLAAFVLARPLAALVAPGFAADTQRLLSAQMRIMLIGPVLFFISNLFGGMLISAKRFLFYGLSPALYNLGIILGALLLAPRFGIHGVAMGTILGALLHLAVRVIEIRRAKLRLVPSLRVSPEVWRVVRLMLPRVAGLTAVQMQLWAFVAIASTIGEGAVTVYSLARNFQSFPVSLIGIAFATALFPLLAESASEGRQADYVQRLTRGSAALLVCVIPAAAGLYLLRGMIVSVLLETGRFDSGAAAATSFVLGVYTLSIPAESLAHVLSRAFFALHNTLLPVAVSVAGIAVSVALAFGLSAQLGAAAIPAGFVAGTALQAGLLALGLWFMLPRLLKKERSG